MLSYLVLPRGDPANTTVTLTYVWSPPPTTTPAMGHGPLTSRAHPFRLEDRLPFARLDVALHSFGGEVRASVPLVGGKLESFALDNLRRDLALAAKSPLVA